MILKGEKKQGNKAAQGHIGEYFPLEIGSYGHDLGGGSTVGKKCSFIIMQPARENNGRHPDGGKAGNLEENMTFLLCSKILQEKLLKK